MILFHKLITIVYVAPRGCVQVLLFAHTGSWTALGLGSTMTPGGTTPDHTLYQPPAGC